LIIYVPSSILDIQGLCSKVMDPYMIFTLKE